MKTTRRETIAVLAGSAITGAGALARPPASAPFSVDVAVIGAGVFGAWTAWHLTRAGASVAVIDQYGAGHARSSSGGESRVIRFGYGDATHYSAMARDSLGWWRALSDRQPLPLFHATGVLWFAPGGDAYTRNSAAWLRQHGVAHSVGDTAWLRDRYPQIRFAEGEHGLLEHDTGALIAGRGVQAVIADAGLSVRLGRIPPPEREPGGDYRVGDMRARSLVYACGPWLAKLFPGLLGGRIRATRQEVHHFGAPPGDPRFAPPALPVWADFNDGAIVYGLPDIEGQGFKIAFDDHGTEIDPDSQPRHASTAEIGRSRAYLQRRFPDLADAPLVHSRVCQYENSSNGDFLIDRLPGHDRVWLIGGGSGHGFKHGPAVGRLVAAHVADPSLAVTPRFSLATKAAVSKRSVY